jgi:hypothetical protein
MDIGILADIDHSVQQAGARTARQVKSEGRKHYCRIGGGVVGQGDEGAWAGAAVIGAAAGAAAGLGRVAGFLAVGLAGFFAAGGPPGVSSTRTGLGRNLGGSPIDVIISSRSVSAW